MKKYLFISIGGFLGSISRFIIKGIQFSGQDGSIPWNTMIANFTGSFFLAFILVLAIDFLKIDANIRLGLTVGFLGAYTTFSTFCKETANLLNEGYYFSAIAYVLTSVFLGLAMAYLGMFLARKIVFKYRTDIKNRTGVDKWI